MLSKITLIITTLFVALWAKSGEGKKILECGTLPPAVEPLRSADSREPFRYLLMLQMGFNYALKRGWIQLSPGYPLEYAVKVIAAWKSRRPGNLRYYQDVGVSELLADLMHPEMQFDVSGADEHVTLARDATKMLSDEALLKLATCAPRFGYFVGLRRVPPPANLPLSPEERKDLERAYDEGYLDALAPAHAGEVVEAMLGNRVARQLEIRANDSPSACELNPDDPFAGTTVMTPRAQHIWQEQQRSPMRHADVVEHRRLTPIDYNGK